MITYEYCTLGDLEFEHVDPTPAERAESERRRKGRKKIPKPRVRVCINGQLHTPGKRFWKSLSQRYGFSDNVFRYISHEKMFKEVARKSKDDKIRVAIEQPTNGIFGTLLGTSNPKKPIIPHDEIMEILEQFDGERVTYNDGIVTSMHRPSVDIGDVHMNGDAFYRGFQMSIPVDGYGQPTSHLMMLRLICSNGMIGENEAFRSMVSLGSKAGDVRPTLERFIEGFNNDDGFSALSQRFETAGKSWASVNEAHKLYRALIANAGGLDLTRRRIGGDGASADGSNTVLLDAAGEPIVDHRKEERQEGSFVHIQRRFNDLTGDISKRYGLASPDAMSQKRQRSLPVDCKVYELLNFATELATHHATPAAARVINAWVGQTLAKEYDLENSCDKFADFNAFFARD